MPKKKGVTAGELLKQLAADPEFVAAEKERDRLEEREEAELQRAEAPLVDALREAGFAVDSVWDLVNTAAPYPRAIRVLLEHLELAYPPAIREGVARALAVPEARHAWGRLVRLYRSESDPRTKEGLAVAVAGAADDADDSVIDKLIELVSDPSNGNRVHLLDALERSANPRAREALRAAAQDPDLAIEAKATLRRLKRRRLRKGSDRKRPRGR